VLTKKKNSKRIDVVQKNNKTKEKQQTMQCNFMPKMEWAQERTKVKIL